MSTVAWECRIGRAGTGPMVPLASLVVRESAEEHGWQGWGRVRQADGDPAATLFARAQEHGLVPGFPVDLHLAPVGQTPVRSWPSILTELEVRPGADDPAAVFVRFADPLTHLAARPVFAVFEGCTPGQVLAGSLARAAGIGAESPSLRVIHPSLPDVHVRERLRADPEPVALAIASGVPLRDFVRSFLAASSLDLEVRGLGSGEVHFDLSRRGGEDSERSASAAVRLAVTCGPEDGEGFLGLRRLFGEDEDGPRAAGRSMDLGIGSGLGTQAVPAGIPDAAIRIRTTNDPVSDLSTAFDAAGWVPRAYARSEATGIRGGGRIEVIGEAVAGVRDWRVLAVTHRLADRGYHNTSLLERLEPSCPAGPAAGERAYRTLTGYVNEEGLARGVPVPVDACGRVPVRLACDPGATIRLPYVVPAAGAAHGFAPACCHGDRVRVRVRNPLSAEVLGAMWCEALTPDDETRRSTQAMQIDSGLGAYFRPFEGLEEVVR